MVDRVRLVAAVAPTNAWANGYWFVNTRNPPGGHGFIPAAQLGDALPILLPHLGKEIDVEA